jgi:hypothetical protein
METSVSLLCSVMFLVGKKNIIFQTYIVHIWRHLTSHQHLQEGPPFLEKNRKTRELTGIRFSKIVRTALIRQLCNYVPNGLRQTQMSYAVSIFGFFYQPFKIQAQAMSNIEVVFLLHLTTNKPSSTKHSPMKEKDISV